MTRLGLHALVPLLVIVPVVLLLPLAGAALADSVPETLLVFPPPAGVPSDVPGCSWFGRVLLPTAIILAGAWLLLHWRQHAKSGGTTGPTAAGAGESRKFPFWGWAAAEWTGMWWVLAWTRFPWFEPLQSFTFFPLWLGFIVTVNAFTWQRRGTCVMLERPVAWLGLFAASAVFWWGFEWLNRFVQNWHYIEVNQFGAAGYALEASVSFSTVLPAVLAVREWLATWPAWSGWCAAAPELRWVGRRGTSLTLIALGIAGLALTGAFPSVGYPALWSAPLALFIGLQVATGSPGMWTDFVNGDWREPASWAAAALICGVFWETWNFHSQAKWIYTVPYVDCWHLFEMPFAGYTGYLPFGLECGVVVRMVIASR